MNSTEIIRTMVQQCDTAIAMLEREEKDNAEPALLELMFEASSLTAPSLRRRFGRIRYDVLHADFNRARHTMMELRCELARTLDATLEEVRKL